MLEYFGSLFPAFVAWSTFRYFCGGLACYGAIRLFWRLVLPRKRHTSRKDNEI